MLIRIIPKERTLSCKGRAFWLVDFDPKLFLCFIRFVAGTEFGAITGTSLLRRFFLIFLILVTCTNEAMSASFPGKRFLSPWRFPSLFLSSLESFSVLFLRAKLGECVCIIIYITSILVESALIRSKTLWFTRSAPFAVKWAAVALGSNCSTFFTAGFDSGKPRRQKWKTFFSLNNSIIH